MINKSNILMLVLIVTAICPPATCRAGKIYREDIYNSTSDTEFNLPRAKVFIQMDLASDRMEDSSHMYWGRSDGHPYVSIFVFDPSYDRCRISSMTMLIDGTNQVSFSFAAATNDWDGRCHLFEPYMDEYAYKDDYPGIKARCASYSPKWVQIPTHALEPGATVRVQVGLELFAKEEKVCQTNVSATFVMERRERVDTWRDSLMRFFMPRF